MFSLPAGSVAPFKAGSPPALEGTLTPLSWTEAGWRCVSTLLPLKPASRLIVRM